MKVERVTVSFEVSRSRNYQSVKYGLSTDPFNGLRHVRRGDHGEAEAVGYLKSSTRYTPGRL